ncbi:P-loop containing nucleoside triphosphate hydrolase protein [Suillus paluster]|uniref:P-loop containing nucleoside triphosphate hydrolase protein n=1 Tax=Suillus paluster TaxID=48578 RepID=UPI001B876764|nr:P-loop containing nucleoside triphosphate hydrolase protein [Suillus paluster]KAG1745355.1 P-loop containing nucleoside triphosphate hydrolase protein [Suillus paluster]
MAETEVAATSSPQHHTLRKDDLDAKAFSVSDTTRPEEPVHLDPHKRPHKVILLFGETGVGKSSLVNLMAGTAVAPTSPDVGRCTMHSQDYTIEFDGESYKVFDTVGLEEPQLGIKQYLDSVENASKLIQNLDKHGGIDLLLLCIRAGRLTATVKSNYRLFHEFLCEKKVPIVLAITNLEREQTMEDWWKRNHKTFRQTDIYVAGHACLTAADKQTLKHPHLYDESRVTIRNLVKEHTADGQKQAWIGGDNLFVSLMRRLKELLAGKAHMKKKDLVSRLMKRCEMTQEIAASLADMIRKDVAPVTT